MAALYATELEIQETVAFEDIKDVNEHLKYQLTTEENTCFDSSSEIDHLYKLDISKKLCSV